MWYLVQIIIVVGLCIIVKSEIAPDRSMGHIFLFSVLVAYAVTWLFSRAIDLVRANGRTCFLISLLITAAVIVWWITSLAREGRPLDAPGFAIMAVIGLCIFVPSMWAVSKGILLVHRLQGHPPPPRPARQPITLAALVARWRTPLTYCIFWLLWTSLVILTADSQDIYPWDNKIATFLGIGRGGPLVISWMIALIAAALAARAIIQRLLRGGNGSREVTTSST